MPEQRTRGNAIGQGIRWLLVSGAMVLSMPAVEAHGGDLKPPPPDPEDPVGYVLWFDQAFGSDIRDNAYDIYLNAYKLIKPFDGKWDRRTYKEPWKDDEVVSKWLKRNRRGLRVFAKAAAKEQCYFRLSDLPMFGQERQNVPMMNVTLATGLVRRHHDATKGLLAEGFRAYAEGDRQKLLDNSLIVLRSAHHIESSPILTARMSGIASRALAYRALLTALHSAEDPDTLATELLPRLQAADTRQLPLRRVYLAERLASWDFCQRVFSSHQQVHDALRVNDEYFDAVDLWARTPYWQAQMQADRLDRLSRDSDSIESYKRGYRRSRVTPLRKLFERATAERRATHLILHLFAYHAKHGTFPRSLDRLNTPDLSELRIDPCSGWDFVYERRRGSFKLYSVADNFRDDGGKHYERWKKDDYVFWPRPGVSG